MHCTIQILSQHSHFKDAQLVTYQQIRFESDEVEFQISGQSKNWKITRMNCAVVGIAQL